MAAHPPVEGRVLLPLLWSSSEGRASRPGCVGRSVRRLSVRQARPGAERRASPHITAMDKRKPYKCPTCGAEVPDEPMPVLRHQMPHVRRRPLRAIGGSPIGLSLRQGGMRKWVRAAPDR